jgi:hypothetical protein
MRRGGGEKCGMGLGVGGDCGWDFDSGVTIRVGTGGVGCKVSKVEEGSMVRGGHQKPKYV